MGREQPVPALLLMPRIPQPLRSTRNEPDEPRPEIPVKVEHQSRPGAARPGTEFCELPPDARAVPQGGARDRDRAGKIGVAAEKDHPRLPGDPEDLRPGQPSADEPDSRKGPHDVTHRSQSQDEDGKPVASGCDRFAQWGGKVDHRAQYKIRGEAPLPVDPRLLDLLCCPMCRQRVAPVPDGSGLQCSGCRRVYPVVDGIPNMLVEDAKLAGE